MKKKLLLPILSLATLSSIALPLASCKSNKKEEEEKEVKVTSIEINVGARQLEQGKSTSLSVKVLPENATDKSVTWSVDKPDLVTIDASTGKVQAKDSNVGEVVITAKANDGSNIESSISLEVIFPFDGHSGYIVDNNTPKYFDSLTGSKICATGGDITCGDGTTYNRSTFNKPIFLNPNLTSIGDYFLASCELFNQPLTLPNSLTSISNYFLESCKSFNQPLTLPNSLTSIGGSFLYYCIVFNQPIIFSNSLTTIGGSFLYICPQFNQPLTLPNSLTGIGVEFLSYCDNMISQINIQDLKANVFAASNTTLATDNNTAPMYQTGIEIVGTHKSDFLTRFPKSNTSPYRKLK